jgi:hypothetical protein
MRHRRRFEAAWGLGAALVGFLNLAYALFVPTYAFQSGLGMFLLGIPPADMIALCIISLGYIGEAAGAVLHSRTGKDRWRLVLWGSWAATAVTVAFLFDIAPGLALLLLPSTLFALVACTLSSRV